MAKKTKKLVLKPALPMNETLQERFQRELAQGLSSGYSYGQISGHIREHAKQLILELHGNLFRLTPDWNVDEMIAENIREIKRLREYYLLFSEAWESAVNPGKEKETPPAPSSKGVGLPPPAKL